MNFRHRNADQAARGQPGYPDFVASSPSNTNPAGKALWFIETHFAGELSLDAIADVAGVSRYHLSRVFPLATGHQLMHYVRARRLTEAARQLAAGAPDILAVALDSGYGSHEAFTRAFRDHFGLTPESARARGALDNLNLQEPIRMDETVLTHLDPPRVVNHPGRLVAGLGQRCNAESSAGIPAQWQRFAPHIGTIPGQTGHATFGVICNADDSGNIEYICAVEVTDFGRLSTEWSRLRIPAQRYAVFHHRDHISAIRHTWFTIYNKGLPESGYKIAVGAPEFERYGEEFDPRTGMGGVEIWIPIQM